MELDFVAMYWHCFFACYHGMMAKHFNFFKDRHWSRSFSIYVALALIIWIHVAIIYFQGVSWLQTFYILFSISLIFVALLPQVRNFYKKVK